MFLALPKEYIGLHCNRVCKFYWWVESLWLLLHKFWSHFGIFGVKYHNEKSHFQTFQPTIVRDTRNSCGGRLTWKAQIHDGSHRVTLIVIYPLPVLSCEKGKDKTVFVTENFWSRSGSLFGTENFWSQSGSLRNFSAVMWTILAYLQTLILSQMIL